MIELIIAIGMFSAVTYLLILLYLAIGIIRTKTELTAEQPFVSIIVSAHNESQNIAVCLDSILHQDYPEHKLELIIVNDRSEDDTGMILERYKENYSHIHIININECQEGISLRTKVPTRIMLRTDCYCGQTYTRSKARPGRHGLFALGFHICLFAGAWLPGIITLGG